jgi:hypothetical protein
VGYDVCFRVGVAFYRPVLGILPDDTVRHIAVMVKRVVNFFKEYGLLLRKVLLLRGVYLCC